ncbi:MAG: ATPase, T2SS/T4P/T4SS family [Methanoculleaceae archaeon]
MKLVPDTSVVIDGRITSLIKEGEYKGATIIIPEAVVAELEAQANQGREIGFSGLTELQNLSKLAEEGTISLEFSGTRPTLDQVKLASGGEIDALIRNVAIEHGALFITSDIVQAEVARAKGLDVHYLRPQQDDFAPLAIDQFFDEDTMEVFLKERAPPMARKGTIRDMRLERLRETPMNEYELRMLAQEVLERAKRHPDGFIEIEQRGVTVAQIGSLRIFIARRPFTDGMEITAVRPITQVTLEDYRHSDLLREHLLRGDQGVIIAGPPGAGKTTLAQSIAVFLSDNDRIVRTMESPRDLQVPDQITQYTTMEGSMRRTAELLLLVRPDWVVFDEMRKKEDFGVYADMRLSGLSMIGVIHAKNGVAALQRFFDRVDFGVLPEIVTTLITVRDGEIVQMEEVCFSIRVPEKMGDGGRPCPVIQIRDLITGEVCTEIFRYEGETIVHTLNSHRDRSGAKQPQKKERMAFRLAEKEIEREIGRYTDGPVYVRMMSDNKAVVYIDDRDVPAAIGKGGKNVAGIVNRLGIGIDIRPRSELPETGPAPVSVVGRERCRGPLIHIERRQLSLISPEHSDQIVDVFAGREYLFTATVDEQGEIHLAKTSSIAQELLRRYNAGESITLRPV